MKFNLMLLTPLLCATVTYAADFTVSWRTLTSSDRSETIMSVGDTRIELRPVPVEKKNDPPRSGIFIGDARATKTAIFPGKAYFVTIVRRGDELQIFVNGCPDALAIPSKLDGEPAIKSRLALLRPATALTPEEILTEFKEFIGRRDVATVGHRGVHMHAPENTKISYVQAIEANTPIVEFDTALSKDGYIVGMHDKTVDRTTDGTGKIAELTLEQLRKLDAGSWKDPKYKGEPVPTIDDIAEVCRGKTILMLDLKSEGQGKAIANWLEKSKYPRDQVILAPWEDAEGIDLRKYVSDVPMIRLTSKIPTETIDDAYFAKMREIGFSGFSINWQNLTKQFIDAARENDMKVYAWTLNDPVDIAGAVFNGVDGVITDDPAATIKLIDDLTTR